MNVAEFTTAARSRIEDADFAAERAPCQGSGSAANRYCDVGSSECVIATGDPADPIGSVFQLVSTLLGIRLSRTLLWPGAHDPFS